MISRDKVLSSNRLPDFPESAVHVIQLTRSNDPDLKAIVTAIKSNEELSRRILRTINSSIFALRKEVTSVDQAVILLGTSTVASLCSGFTIMGGFKPRRKYTKDYLRCVRNSLTNAAAAETLIECSGRNVTPEFFTAGLIKDVGIMALLRVAPDDYAPILSEYERGNHPLLEMELDHLGFTNLEISEVLMRRWNLPEDIRLPAVAHNVMPHLWMHNDDPHLARIQRALATAGHITELLYREHKASAWEKLLQNAKRYYDISDKKITSFLKKVVTKITETGELFAIDMSLDRSLSEILAIAEEQLQSRKAAIIQQPIEIIPEPEPVPEPEPEAVHPRALSQDETIDLGLEAPKDIELPRDREARVSSPEIMGLSRPSNSAFREPESGAYSLEFFQELARFEFNRSARYRGNLGIILVEFTNKDKPLSAGFRRQFAQEVKDCLRSTDVVAAAGYRTFAILALSPLVTGLGIVSERVRKIVQSHKRAASIGAIVAWPAPGATGFEELWELAEKALGEAKSFGPGQNVILTLQNTITTDRSPSRETT